MKRYLLAISAFALSLFVFDGAAQAWPTKPLRAIVPVGAGSSTDIVHRLVLEQLSVQLGQPIVVENRVGAGGTIGSAVVAKSEPDGYTILAHGSALTIAPALYKGLPYHPARDFIAVVPVGISASVLVVSPAKGVSSAAELVAVAKARPGALNFSSVGVGSATHLSAERFVSSAGIQVVHVPFKGGAEAMLEVIAGRVDFFLGPVALVLPHIREGKLRALAVNGSSRSTLLPDVPTFREAGIKEAEYPIWFALFVPAKTPSDIVNRLNRETLNALQAPKTREKLAALGVDPMVMSPAEFAAHIDQEIALNAMLVQQAGVKAE
ncbi:MAG: tripartite tricarboxylate transporter substrate binding protein [Betaproteobacteria bacterium]|nr:tripartite tricarboxylate transporter substrate binding protein [Betaproteobacteria bacterium]MBA3776172.1 tripartite tricarboxylate transporter substrate binding protein [Betaproteobacteria bacterium]